MVLYGQTAGGAGQPSMLSALLPFIIIFVIFYFLIIMPARRKQKKHQELIGGLKGGERVITAGGIYGTVTRVMDDRIEVEVDKNTKLQVAKSSVSGIIDKSGTEVKPK